jgi:FKBP-type peptidyl-prolyl cis-trans isomerase
MNSTDKEVVVVTGIFIIFILVVGGLFLANNFSLNTNNGEEMGDTEMSVSNGNPTQSDANLTRSDAAAEREKPEIDPEELSVDRLAEGELVTETLIESDLESEVTVESGDTVEVNYIGSLTDGTVFDNSYDRGQTFEFEVGAGRVIQGWDRGLEGATVGERLLLLIPSDLGYGSQGAGDSIPPDADLVFIVDVVGVTK